MEQTEREKPDLGPSCCSTETLAPPLGLSDSGQQGLRFRC